MSSINTNKRVLCSPPRNTPSSSMSSSLTLSNIIAELLKEKEDMEKKMNEMKEENKVKDEKIIELNTSLKKNKEVNKEQKQKIDQQEQREIDLENKTIEQKTHKYSEEDKQIATNFLLDKFPYLKSAAVFLSNALEHGVPTIEFTEKGITITQKNPVVEVYYGPTQAGKTKASLNFAYLCVLKGISIVYMSMNSLSQSSQLRKRVDEIKEDNELFTHEQISCFIEENRLPVIKFSTIEKVTRIKDDEKKDNNKEKKTFVNFKKFELKAKTDPNTKQLLSILKGIEHGVISCMGNTARLHILSQLTSHYNTKFALHCDEIDQQLPYDDKDTERKLNKDYMKIHNEALMVVGTTATSVKVWLNDHINFQKVKALPLPKCYIGFKELVVETKTFDGCKAICGEKDNINKIPGLIPFITQFINEPQYNNLTSRKTGKQGLHHPRHLLVNFSRNMKHQQELFDHLRILKQKDLHGKHFTAIVANSDRGGYKVYDTRFSKHKTITMPMYGYDKPEKAYLIDNYFQMSKPTYGDIISFFSAAHINEGRQIGNIFGIGGDIFKRGNAFTSNDYMITPTDMLYIPPKDTCKDIMIQAVGRLNGCYPHFHDQIKYTLHTTKSVENEVRFGIENISLINNYGREEHEHENLNVYLQSGEVKLPGCVQTTRKFFNAKKGKNVKLDNKVYENDGCAEVNIKAGFEDKTVADKHSDMYSKNATPGYKNRNEGRDLRENYVERTGTPYKPVRVQPTIHDSNNSIISLDINEYNRLVNNMFPKWSKTNSNISNFMKSLKPEKLYTKKEMKELVVRTGIGMITLVMKKTFQNSSGWGNIIQFSNDHYKLYPTLVIAYNKNFK